jgi:hypothetical protein
MTDVVEVVRDKGMDGPQSSTMSSIPVKLMNSTGGTNFSVTHRVAESIECIGVVNDRYSVCVCVLKWIMLWV